MFPCLSFRLRVSLAVSGVPGSRDCCNASTLIPNKISAGRYGHELVSTYFFLNEGSVLFLRLEIFQSEVKIGLFTPDHASIMARNC